MHQTADIAHAFVQVAATREYVPVEDDSGSCSIHFSCLPLRLSKRRRMFILCLEEKRREESSVTVYLLGPLIIFFGITSYHLGLLITSLFRITCNFFSFKVIDHFSF